MRRSAPVAANAPPRARPAPRPTRCHPPTRCCANCARCFRLTHKPAARRRCCCGTTASMAAKRSTRWRGMATACNGERAAGRGQRDHPGRIEIDRRGLCLWRLRGAFPVRAKPRHDMAAWRKATRWPSRFWPGSDLPARASPPSRRTTRTCWAQPCARLRRCRRSQNRQASQPSAANATWCGWPCANCTRRPRRRSIWCRCRKARHSARSKSKSKAARCACLACRPARPARMSATIRNSRCCVSPKMPACNAGYAQATCPEKVISLETAARFPRSTAIQRVIKQEEPCQLHPLRQALWGQKLGRTRGGQARRPALDVQGIPRSGSTSSRMCADCRVNAMAEEQFDPFGGPARPAASHHRRLSARARATRVRRQPEILIALSDYFFVAFPKNSTSAWRSCG